jgi:stage V sporulation protein SpoVS
MNLDNTYTRTVDAIDSGSAQQAVKAMATAEGYRVKTVRSVRLMVAPQRLTGLDAWTPARYRVELAVGRGS